MIASAPAVAVDTSVCAAAIYVHPMPASIGSQYSFRIDKMHLSLQTDPWLSLSQGSADHKLFRFAVDHRHLLFEGWIK